MVSLHVLRRTLLNLASSLMRHMGVFSFVFASDMLLMEAARLSTLSLASAASIVPAADWAGGAMWGEELDGTGPV